MLRPALLLITLLCLPLLTPESHSAEDATAGANNHTNLIPQLEKFRPFLGKTYRGEFVGPQQNKVVDVATWERALNGTAIRILHSMNEGEYGGESIIFYDKSEDALRFYYFTTAGFYTEGRSHFDGQNFVSTEIVNGNKDGITKVESTASLTAAGGMTMHAKFMKGDQVVNTHKVNYTPVDNLAPVFR